VARDAYWAVSGYVAGNVVISLVAGGVAYVVLRVLGVPFALPLAVLVAFLDLIPLLGATVAGIAVALVTLFHHFPVATIVWILVVLVYQQVENQVVQPIIYRKTVDMHPLLVIVAVLAGAALLGILGVLLAIPVAATVQIVVARAWALRAAAEPTPAPAPGGDG
jgi:predicted PurR-regulated permease PerM